MEANSQNMIFLAHESITAIKHLQVILFPQLHLYNSIVRKIQPSFTSAEHRWPAATLSLKELGFKGIILIYLVEYESLLFHWKAQRLR